MKISILTILIALLASCEEKKEGSTSELEFEINSIELKIYDQTPGYGVKEIEYQYDGSILEKIFTTVNLADWSDDFTRIESSLEREDEKIIALNSDTRYNFDLKYSYNDDITFITNSRTFLNTSDIYSDSLLIKRENSEIQSLNYYEWRTNNSTLYLQHTLEI